MTHTGRKSIYISKLKLRQQDLECERDWLEEEEQEEDDEVGEDDEEDVEDEEDDKEEEEGDPAAGLLRENLMRCVWSELCSPSRRHKKTKLNKQKNAASHIFEKA